VQGQLAIPRLVIAAAHKSSGKTTLSIGIGRVLSETLAVQAFKKGPDYIDPMWLARATGRPCYNLDFNTQTPGEIAAMAGARARDADFALIETNKGLFDGMDLEGADCNGALAKLLGAPVILVIDTEGITRGIAPLLLGYKMFDPELRIAGVILNRVAGPRHEGKLRAAVERYSDIPVLGSVRRDPRLAVAERHLGLTTPAETGEAEARIGRIAAAVRDGVEIAKLRAIAEAAACVQPASAGRTVQPAQQSESGTRVRIAVARDTAFGFYYPDDIEALGRAGADLVYFDALSDARLPECDGLLIGGGFPETQLAALEANASLRADIRRAIERGLPAYAECGGLMYLCRSITFGAERREMVGVVPADAVMCDRPQGRGQVRLVETGAAPWPAVAGSGGTGFAIPAHEFHYAVVRNLPDGLAYAFDMARGAGIGGRRDGVVIANLLATFSHQRDTARNPWTRRFVAFVRQHAAQGKAAETGCADRSRAEPAPPSRKRVDPKTEDRSATRARPSRSTA